MSDSVCAICGTPVTEWSARYENDVTHCKSCFKSDAAKAYLANKQQLSPTDSAATSVPHTTTTSSVTPDAEPLVPAKFTEPFRLLLDCIAWVSLVGSIFAGFKFATYTERGTTEIDGTVLMAFAFGGLMTFGLFVALQKIIYLLHVIANKQKPY